MENQNEKLAAGLAAAKEAAGSGAALGRLIGLTKDAVNTWDEIPLNRVLEIERVTGVDREILRPDMFDRSQPENTEAAASD